VNRGDVVEVNWPDSDLMGSKVRPAVVVQADFLNGLIDDTIFVQITSTKHGIPGTEVEIDPAVETASGLRHLCYANCANVLTRDQALVGPVIGSLSGAILRQIEACLKVVLEIR
jgi:mRNA-degrading endonuclease toxin of MazEF toxin-antitoxin module